MQTTKPSDSVQSAWAGDDWSEFPHKSATLSSGSRKYTKSLCPRDAGVAADPVLSPPLSLAAWCSLLVIWVASHCPCRGQPDVQTACGSLCTYVHQSRRARVTQTLLIDMWKTKPNLWAFMPVFFLLATTEFLSCSNINAGKKLQTEKHAETARN